MEGIIDGVPDVVEYTLGPRDKLLVLGCDGVFHTLGNEKVCEVAMKAWGKESKHGGVNANATAKKLCQAAKRNRGNSDDSTAAVLRLAARPEPLSRPALCGAHS